MTTEQTTLRDELSKNFDAAVEPEVVAEVHEPEVEKPGRTAGRPRDEKGRLLPGKVEKEEVKTEEPKAEVVAEAPKEVAKPRPARPSTWKKEYWDHWEKIDPSLAEYLHQREGEYAKGVSTYKTEYDRVKPVDEALKPYLPFFQQSGVKPEQAISALMQNHQTFTYGTPEQKLQQFARLAQDYQIPLQQLLVKGDDGQVYFNQQYFQQQQTQQPNSVTLQDVQKLLQQERQVATIQAAISQFVSAKDGSGQPLYPHFETVRQTMDGILRAGLAQDLPSAYDAALRLPQHADLFEAQQNAKREAEQAAQVKAKAEQAARARQAAVSTKSSSVTGTLEKGDKGSKGLRDHISAAFEQIESGRV